MYAGVCRYLPVTYTLRLHSLLPRPSTPKPQKRARMPCQRLAIAPAPRRQPSPLASIGVECGKQRVLEGCVLGRRFECRRASCQQLRRHAPHRQSAEEAGAAKYCLTNVLASRTVEGTGRSATRRRPLWLERRHRLQCGLRCGLLGWLRRIFPISAVRSSLYRWEQNQCSRRMTICEMT